MNYVQHLNQFLAKVEKTDKVQPTHISLYLALFQLWNQNRFQNPVTASRSELMRVSKISSYTTYYKCIHDLSSLDWIVYTPSNSIYRGSCFHLKPFRTIPLNNTSADTGGGTPPDTGSGLEMVSFSKTDKNILNTINNKPNQNKKNYEEQF
ncbi:hypothetical protein [Myroides guanonis]|uniref:Helix-turn-helix domain-containing protein n=1 Tax=Myroides guanonis TaxID=1150112 RepID=A0A1I3L282_9FLAO|nr:hypothetical protein [Myroides guanonis]SFI78718.1 hypothetical protein SAMN04487893_101144 [Myroides guanonis]